MLHTLIVQLSILPTESPSKRIVFQFLFTASCIAINTVVASSMFGLILSMNLVWTKRGTPMSNLKIAAIILQLLLTAASNENEEKFLGESCHLALLNPRF